jgi:hypothetical protein
MAYQIYLKLPQIAIQNVGKIMLSYIYKYNMSRKLSLYSTPWHIFSIIYKKLYTGFNRSTMSI